jgi:hypothetical protein
MSGSRALAQGFDPVREAFGEELGGQRVHQIVERVMRGHALFEGQQAAQEAELLLGPTLDLAKVLGAGHRAAEHDEQDFRERVNHLPRLAGVFECGEMVEKRLLGHQGPR